MKKIISLLLLLASFSQSFAQVIFDNYANINTIGISIDLGASDPQGDLQANLEYKKLSDPIWLKGFELSQANSVHPNMLNSSLFNCEPNTTYQIKITLIDGSTPALNGVYFDTITTQQLMSFSSFTNTYYVSPLGSGTAFTLANPGSLQSALALVQGGQRIILLGGTYHVGSLTLNQSGTKNNPITIQGEAGQNVILDGSQTAVINWQTDGTGYKGQIQNKHCNVVIADGVRLYPHKSLKELRDHKIVWEGFCRDAGIEGFFRSGNLATLRLNFTDGTHPDSIDLKVGEHNTFITLPNVNWVRFNNLSFKYYGSENKAAIILKNANNIQFDYCTFGHNDIGIKLEQNTNNILVDHCEFYDSNGDWNFWRMKASYQGVYLLGCSGTNWPNDVLPGTELVNNYDNRGVEKGGFFVNGDYSGRGIIIKESSFHDMVQGLSISPQSYWVDPTGKTAEVDFYNNEVYNCSEDGLEADTYPRNVRVWGNEFHHVNAAISIAEGADGPIYIFNNIFHDFTTDTTWISSFGNTSLGRPIKTNASDIANTGYFYFMHNTVYAQNSHFSMDILKVGTYSWDRHKFLNNIWQSENQYAFRIRTTNFGPFLADYNCFFNTGTSSLISINSSNFPDIPSYTAQYFVDSNSLNVDPIFVAASTNDFHLACNSPLIDAGIVIDGLNEGFKGAAPDIGAFESASTASGTATITACDSLVWIDGMTYYSSNNTATFTIAGGGANSCDSLVTLDLSIATIYSSTDAQTACDSLVWMDGITYYSNNTSATFNIPGGANSCDTLVTLNLMIQAPNGTVSQNGNVLSATAQNATYQWLNCPAMTPINGETNQSFTATANGNYAVQITSNACTVTSTCTSVSTVGISQNDFGNKLQVYPNPTQGKILIDLGKTYQETTLTLLDLSGRILQTNTSMNAQFLNLEMEHAAGVYLLHIKSGDKRGMIRLLIE